VVKFTQEYRWCRERIGQLLVYGQIYGGVRLDLVCRDKKWENVAFREGFNGQCKIEIESKCIIECRFVVNHFILHHIFDGFSDYRIKILNTSIIAMTLRFPHFVYLSNCRMICTDLYIINLGDIQGKNSTLICTQKVHLYQVKMTDMIRDDVGMVVDFSEVTELEVACFGTYNFNEISVYFPNVRVLIMNDASNSGIKYVKLSGLMSFVGLKLVKIINLSLQIRTQFVPEDDHYELKFF